MGGKNILRCSVLSRSRSIIRCSTDIHSEQHLRCDNDLLTFYLVVVMAAVSRNLSTAQMNLEQIKHAWNTHETCTNHTGSTYKTKRKHRWNMQETCMKHTGNTYETHCILKLKSSPCTHNLPPHLSCAPTLAIIPHTMKQPRKLSSSEICGWLKKYV